MGNLGKIFDFNLSDADIKQIKIALGTVIMVCIFTGFYIIALCIAKSFEDIVLVVLLNSSIFTIYGAIGVIIQKIFKTKPEDIPIPPIANPNLT